MLAADRDFIDFDALRTGAPAVCEHAAGTVQRFVRCWPPMLNYWEVLLPFAPSHAPVVVRFGVADDDAPSAAQLAFIRDVEDRFMFYLAIALVRLKPALAKYVSRTVASRPLYEEFVVTGMFVGPVDTAGTPATDWQLLMRCRTDPTYEFMVRFRGQSVSQLLVDQTVSSV